MFTSPFRVTGYKTPVTFCLLLVVSMNLPADGSALPGEDEAFTRAVETYRAEENEEAVQLFQSFAEEYPDSTRIDDTYWYLGRLYTRMEDRDTAIAFYQRVLQWPERSSRLSAALYDLAKIHYREKEYREVTDLLDFHETGESLNRNDLRFLFLAGKSFYHLGYRELRDDNRPEAAAYFTRAIDIFTLVGGSETDIPGKTDALLALGETCLKAMDAAEHRASYTTLYETLSDTVAVLEELVTQESSADFEVLKRKLEHVKGMDFSADVEGFGGFSTLALTPGFRIGVDVELDIPLGFRQELQARIGYDHDSFGLKTFNFLPEETGAGDIRLIQSTDDVSGKISWIAGSRRFIFSRFTVSGGAGQTDDPEDTYVTVKADESIDFRLNRYLKTGMDVDIRRKNFPRYLVNNRKLDYIKGTVSPYLQVYPLANLNLKTSYRFELKQYLDAKYESSPGVPAEKSRQYIVNSAGVSINAKMGPVFRPSLGYTFTYNKSNNYNITVNGLPADIFVQGYYDYYGNDIKVKTDFRWSKRFRTDIDGSVSFRNFINYPARDETKTFTGEIRKDTEITINGSAEYMFQPEKKNRVARFGIVIDTGYVNSISNMTYEKSFDTNHEYATFLLGLHMELP